MVMFFFFLLRISMIVVPQSILKVRTDQFCLSYFLSSSLTHCGLVKPYGDRDLGQHWLRYWLVAWRHQTITWTTVDWSSMKSSDIHSREISQEMPQPSITKICLKITCLKFNSKFPGANELIIHVYLLLQVRNLPAIDKHINMYKW